MSYMLLLSATKIHLNNILLWTWVALANLVTRLISSFVQSSIDAALAEYVAPKSLSLDLKDMLLGDDFKKNTNARGVLVVTVINAKGFKEGDRRMGLLKKGSSEYHQFFFRVSDTQVFLK